MTDFGTLLCEFETGVTGLTHVEVFWVREVGPEVPGDCPESSGSVVSPQSPQFTMITATCEASLRYNGVFILPKLGGLFRKLMS